MTAAAAPRSAAPKRWVPKRVLVSRAAAAWPLTATIVRRARALGSEIVELKADRLEGLRGADARETYAIAKQTLAVVVSPPSQRTLQPIPPSADWQFHLARGCPAHCQYCYLAGSLAGPPVTRVYANLPEILAGLAAYLGEGRITSASDARANEGTTFEASCYTDPLALEHLSGALSETVRFFGAWQAPVQLRWTTKFDDVASLLALDHGGRTRARFSVNAASVVRTFEGGTAGLDARLDALARMATAGYPVGVTIAPIMAIPHWRDAYAALLRAIAARTAAIADLDMTVEAITHRFTPGSRDVLMSWYPATTLDLEPARRTTKRTKFGSLKYVYPKPLMGEMRAFFENDLAATLPRARLLYWT